MGLTQQQEDMIRSIVKKSETEGIYICQTCKMKLKGQLNIRRHVSIHKHHTFKIPGSKLILAIG